jgi:hypothetical protein
VAEEHVDLLQMLHVLSGHFSTVGGLRVTLDQHHGAREHHCADDKPDEQPESCKVQHDSSSRAQQECKALVEQKTYEYKDNDNTKNDGDYHRRLLVETLDGFATSMHLVKKTSD